MDLFQPYEGDKPYIFISYAHANSPQVMDVIGRMHGRGYRIWYDEGIEVGSEWPECIASHLAGAHLMMAFISNAYMNSDNCRREMHFAVSRRIKVINVFLEDTQMTPGMEMQIGNIFALMKYNMTDKVFFDKLYAAPLLNSEAFSEEPGAEAAPPAPKPEKKEKKPKVPKPVKAKEGRTGWKKLLTIFLAVALLGGLIALGIVGYVTGLGQRLMISAKQEEIRPLSGSVETVFEDPIFEQIARDYSGITEGPVYVSDLAGLRELYIIGSDHYFSQPPETAADTAKNLGNIRVLTDLQYFTELDRLSIIRQKLSSLESMPGCAIEYLDISQCNVSSLEGIGRLTELRSLAAEGCPIRDLGDIDQCLKLRSINLSSSSLSDFSVLKPLTKLNEFTISNCALDEMKTVLNMNRITQAGFYGCDLRGRFFKSFDREWKIVNMTLDHCQLNSTDNIEDFTGLTTLTLISSGEDLDWSGLEKLPALSKVYYDQSMAAALERALGSSGVQLIPIEQSAA